jgi:uncharacterized protein (DUF58 family)
MNCKQTREAIGSSSRRNALGDSVNSHLSGCHDCRHHADETDSLLALLKAQPRVEAPADFDFRLRARIARAEAEKASPVGAIQGIWERFLAQTFSWKQATAAMAAVAVVISVSTTYLYHNNGATVAPSVGELAVVTPAQVSPKIDLPVESGVAPTAPVRSAPVRTVSRSVKAMPVAFRPEASAQVASKDAAIASNMARFYSRETRQVIQDRNAFGAELVSAKSAAPSLTF